MSRQPVADAFSVEPRSGVAAALLPWFGRSARDLPWRKDRTGYRVWVSEVMLQRTRVATVIPYYERFLTAFPSIRDLATADIDQVLALWSGLGYYRRARSLHEGARDVVARFGGELPRSVELLRTIKGIGPYTAGAIASMAFGIRTPLVDGNVLRVLVRLHAIREDARQTRVQRRLWSLAEALVPADLPGLFNEALMELGATVCLPRDPLCLLCPLAFICEGNRLGIAASLPILAPPRPLLVIHAAALIAKQADSVLLGRRRGDVLFGGLWEPPLVEASSPEEASRCLASFAASPIPVGKVQHILSHRKMHVTVFQGNLTNSPRYPEMYEEVRWVKEDNLHLYGISTLARKLLAQGVG
ncbi:MAG: A/G-specific adenine glycosylase [Myxococcales bacterium]|nr:A/G-specific adenine glycosylase [Polyangiaceae bacterium]MDW8249303.1 A/G-specific adenine glycosylase [Myxococcales bacterium]